ncbi:hypothetical protein MES4922_110323 [Mesorhizobium ventifaucium]|uniref:Uncharacterized protein n=1 Tax=Mesorhizobium ventifaucium TaxID=666020 RepID=A0ABN8JDZ7_9HYPH|nr:hypothetical protein MES4922_110323 [Mesorhizobium ventifaucium]
MRFLATILTGRWEHASGFRDYLTSAAGLIAGGVLRHRCRDRWSRHRGKGRSCGLSDL